MKSEVHVITGSSSSLTVIKKEQVASFPLSSTTVQIISVPSDNASPAREEPPFMLLVTDPTPQLSEVLIGSNSVP